MAKELIKKMEALRVAEMMGCSGAHKDKDGNWMPCSSRAVMMRISNSAESDDFLKRYAKKEFSETVDVIKAPRKKGKKPKPKNGWERLGSRGVLGIDRIAAGIVSAPVAIKAAFYGPEYVRDNDPDVFTDPESARTRSRQLGCIGISRRVSKTGKTVWMPCTNMSDYARVSGSTALGRRGRDRGQRQAIRTVLREELKKMRRKSSLQKELLD